MSPATGQSGRRAFVSATARRWFFFVSLAATLPIMATLGKLNEPLQNGIAANGVVSLELAHSLDRQREVLGSWKEPELLPLAFSIGLDFLCVVAFTATMALACMWLTDRIGGVRIGRAVVYGLLTMAVVWTLQNVLLAGVVFGHPTALAAEIIYWCALWKFTVMGGSVTYVTVAGGMRLVRSI